MVLFCDIPAEIVPVELEHLIACSSSDDEVSSYGKKAQKETCGMSHERLTPPYGLK